LQRWIVFSEDDARLLAEGANIRRQNRIYFANVLRTTRSTLPQNLTNMRAYAAKLLGLRRAIRSPSAL